MPPRHQAAQRWHAEKPSAQRAVVAALLLAGALVAGPAQAQFVVNSTGDEAAQGSTGNGVCNSTAGTCTLRAAIEEANGTAGANTITFNIAPAGAKTIVLGSALPIISTVLTIDGTTQPGFAGNPIIEVNAAGGGATAALRLEGASSGSTIRGLVINRSPGLGVRIITSINNTIAGNFIGTNLAGNSALGTGNQAGIFIQSSTGNLIGGTSAADRNVISGNATDGIQITGAATNTNTVQGNYIGLDVTGTVDLGNTNQGVTIYLGADNNTIGGTVLGSGNVISGNNNGIAINDAGTTGNVVQGNRIGTDWTGTVAVGNTLRGITLDGGSTNNTIGGTVAGAGNTIAFNGSEGVWLNPTVSGIAIEGNSIFSNAGMGIDLNGNGFPELNDTGDGDAGSNTSLNQPALTAAMTNGTQATFAGSYNSTAAVATYRIEFFASSAADGTGYGEGQRYLGFSNITTDTAGNATIGVTLTPPSPLVPGEWVTATATRTVAPFNTSEFGGAVQAFGHLVVTTTADTVDGNTASVSALIANPGNPGDGRISLREAILAVNATAGTDTITFGIPLTDANHLYYQDNGVGGTFAAPTVTTLADQSTPSSPVISNYDADYPAGMARSWYRIQPTSALPNITGGIVLDATTQPLSLLGGPVIEIAGSLAGAGASGLTLAAGSSLSTIRGFVINQFTTSGIVVNASNNNVIERSYLGTDVAGIVALGSGLHGVHILNGANNNTIGGLAAGAGNVISGNATHGVEIGQVGTTANRVLGNLIGLGADGNTDVGNTQAGVAIRLGATANIIGDAGTGRNIISGNTLNGVHITDAGTSNNEVRNNIIGLDATGTLVRANGADGVRLDASAAATGNIVGGTVAGLGNVISGNVSSGIDVRDFMTGTLVAGNLIGTNPAGTPGIGNGLHGVLIVSGATNTTVGGLSAAARNVLSGNGGQGVRIDGPGTNNNVVAGNFIGTDVAGTGALGNTSGGIAITNGVANNTVGGIALGAGNRIAFNATYGVNVAAAAGTGNGILGNAIFGNVAELGIDLFHEPGVTANDLGDVDGGPNNGQNFPVLSGATTNVTDHVVVGGSLNSAANTTYRIELFASAVADGSGFGEGQTFLGSTNVTTDATGNAVIGVSLAAAVAAGNVITATATDPSNNTSEFSGAIPALGSLVVTTTADTVDGNVTSVSALITNPGPDNRISLREAIQATNATAGTDTIRFGIPLTDAGHLYYQNNSIAGTLTTVQTAKLADVASPSSVAIPDFDPDYPTGMTRSWYRIRPTSALPAVTGGVVIDGSTQPGYLSGAPVIEIDGTLAGAVSGLVATAGPTTIRGLVVNRFQNDGLNLRGPAGFTVTGNYIGTDVSGTKAAGNGSLGIFLTNLTGAASQIGGSTAALRNVISANGAGPSPDKNGIKVYNYFPPVNTVPVRIQGNYIGTDVTGTAGLGVQLRGIVLEYTGGHQIGGSLAGEGNLISGNAGPGIDMNGNMDTSAGGGAPTDNNVIEGNRIGTNAAGTGAIPNAGPAIQMYGLSGPSPSASGNTIRGNVLAASTTVDAHGIAVWGNADNNLITGNFIGTDAGGTIDLGNAGSGIHIEVIGAQVPTGNMVQNNVIRFNDVDGVRVLGSGSVATLTQNQMSGNTGLGIDLNGDGVTANDPLDADSGPNDLLNYPLITGVTESGGSLTVNFKLDAPAGSYRIEVFKNPSGTDPSGFGEGETFVGFKNVTHPGGGGVFFNYVTPGVVGDRITLTATACTDGAVCAAFGSTSEFAKYLAATTAVTLQSFTAAGRDLAVDLSWTTASELQNLGFHLYRADSAAGPYRRITASLIPGLGSSATGQTYSYRDSGLVNGQTYYYELEDIETTGTATRHGPVSATPSAAPSSAPSSETAYGDPSSVVLREIERDGTHVTLELLTGGFLATPTEDGRVRLRVPGFESASLPGEPSLPMRRAFVPAVAGRKVFLTSVSESDIVSYPGLRPTSEGLRDVEADGDGSVAPAERAVAEGASFRRRFPPEAARLVGTAFQGETKKAEVLLFPLRWDGNGLSLARRLVVRLEFTGREERESPRGGARGRRPVARSIRGRGASVAQLVVREPGLCRVGYEDVVPASAPGRAPRAFLPVSSLRLSRQGESVAFHVEPDTGRFEPGSSLFFLSEGASLNPYGDAVYELETNTPGRQMDVVRPSRPTSTVTEYVETAEREENHYYQSGLLEAPDQWLWAVIVSPGSGSYPFTVDQISAGGAGRLSVVLQAASDVAGVVDHHVKVGVNGQMLGEDTWDGKTARTVEADVPAGLLREGANTLEVEDVGDTGAPYSMVFLNRFRVSYARRLVAAAGTLRGRFESTGLAFVEAVGPGATVLDTTDAPRWVTDVRPSASGVSFPVDAGRSYIVSSTFLRPQTRLVPPSRLRSPTNQADYLVVAPRSFLAAAEPLLARRASEGLRTKAVSVEEIYEQFGHGEAGPQAIKEFLEFAYQAWAEPSLRYVLLLGDASYDPKDYLGTGTLDRIPGYPVKTSYLWTVSDPAYASVNGEDALPDIAMGRLSASTPEEASRLVAKVLAFETGGGDFGGRAVLVADNPDEGGDFEADADEIAATVFADRSVEKIYYSREGAGTRNRIKAAFDEGASFLSYVGHGGTAVWASENVFNVWDVASLASRSRQPFLTTMNCLSGFFQFPPLNALSEELVKAEGKGAIAAFSPSGLSVDAPAHLYQKLLLQEIQSGRHARLGDAILAAQEDYAASGALPELLAIYNLLGDPALRIR